MEVQEISENQFHSKMRDDPVFRDYFNKFCCLPIFGQRIAFMHRKIKFAYDPSPLKNMQDCYKVQNSFVRDWLMQERLPKFLRSKVACEFHLVRALLEMKYVGKKQSKRHIAKNFSIPANDLDRIYYILDNLKKRHLVRAGHMNRFRSIVQDSADKEIISFWIEAEHIRHIDVDKRAGALRKVQRRYLMSASFKCLPHHILRKVYPEWNSFDQYGFDLDRIAKLQSLILHRLHCYWLPTYLVTCKKISTNESTLLKKIKAMDSTDLKEEMILKALDKHPFARIIPDPEAEINAAARRAQKNKEYVVFEDDDEENILVTEEHKEEIWHDEDNQSSRVHDSKISSELLGSENIEFIHDHIFGKDYAPVLETISKKGKRKHKKIPEMENTDEEYVLYPGKKFVVKRTSSSSSSNSSNDESQCSSVNKKSRKRLKKRLSLIEESSKTPRLKEKKFTHHQKERPRKEISRVAKTSSNVDSLPGIEQHRHSRPIPPRKSKSDTLREPKKAPRKSISSVIETTKKHEVSFDDNKQLSKMTHQVLSQISNSDSSSSSEFSSSEKSTNSTETSSTDESSTSTSSSFATTWDKSSHTRNTSKETLIPDASCEHPQKLTQSYLRLRDVLTSDKIANYPFRDFLSKETKLVYFDIRTKAEGDYKIHKQIAPTKAYDVWREVETLRVHYYLMSSQDLKEKFNVFLSTFSSNSSSPFHCLLRVTIQNDRVFPELLETLQTQLEKQILGPEWTQFAIEEQKNFRIAVMTTDKFTFQERYSYPNSLAEIRAKPILHKPLLTDTPLYFYDEFQELVKVGNLGTLTPNGGGSMRYRVARAHWLFMNSMGINIERDNKVLEFVGGESSDEEEGIPPAKPKVYVRLPQVEVKEIAKRSAVEYPRRGIDYKQCVVLRMRTQQKLEGQPLYLRPVKKHGIVLQRPPERPKCLDNVLRDPLHYEFFKRYMKLHNSEAPLLFWKSVELLKRTENPMARQKKAQQILKKFFSRVAGGGIMLQCESDVIKELTTADTVTTSMLVQISLDVFKNMEKNWAERYFNTFSEPYEEEEEQPVVEKKFNVQAFKTSRVWAALSEYMRRVARFLKCMQDAKQYHEFYKYLAKLPDRPDSTLIGRGGRNLTKFISNQSLQIRLEHFGDASSTALLFQKYETLLYKHQNTDLEIKHRTKHINGKTIALNFLVNDLAFWMENSRYIALYDNAASLIESGRLSTDDIATIAKKKDTIIKCFLDSYVPPKIRINMSSEMTQGIMQKAIEEKDHSRAVFHPGMLAVFPNIIHFWTRFRNEKFSYVSKQTIKRKHYATVEERRRKIEHNVKIRRKKLAAKVPRAQIATSTDSTSSMKLAKNSMLPDYVNDLSNRPYDKVKGLLHNDPPTLHFSLEQGLKLIVPPRKRMIGNVANKDSEIMEDDDFFLKVWTRGAKVVNVFRRGSDPKLVNLDDAKRRFKVKCDLIES